MRRKQEQQEKPRRKKGKSWKTVPDADVRHVWQCEHEGCPEQDCVVVAPTFYAEGGTPVCKECGEDMVYVRTEVRVP